MDLDFAATMVGYAPAYTWLIGILSIIDAYQTAVRLKNERL